MLRCRWFTGWFWAYLFGFVVGACDRVGVVGVVGCVYLLWLSEFVVSWVGWFGCYGLLCWRLIVLVVICWLLLVLL